MAKLLITTQVYENYAIHADGSYATGAEAYWKPKGGNDYIVRNVDEASMDDIIVKVSQRVECDSVAYRETVMCAELVADDYLTEFERQQLEYDGKILYPSQEVLV